MRACGYSTLRGVYGAEPAGRCTYARPDHRMLEKEVAEERRHMHTLSFGGSLEPFFVVHFRSTGSIGSPCDNTAKSFCYGSCDSRCLDVNRRFPPTHRLGCTDYILALLVGYDRLTSESGWLGSVRAL